MQLETASSTKQVVKIGMMANSGHLRLSEALVSGRFELSDLIQLIAIRASFLVRQLREGKKQRSEASQTDAKRQLCKAVRTPQDSTMRLHETKGGTVRIHQIGKDASS